MTNAQTLLPYAVKKTSNGSAEAIPCDTPGLPERGAIFLRHGMYWRDVSRTSVNFDKRIFSFDEYQHGRSPIQGHIDLGVKVINEMIVLCNDIWVKPGNSQGDHSHESKRKRAFITLVLADGKQYRVVPDSVNPMTAVTQLWNIFIDLKKHYKTQ